MTARRPLLLPFVPLYSAALAIKARLHSDSPRHLAHPILSVGSLSAGGAGKTPVVAALATLLLRHRYSVDILSRGYRRASRAIARVDPAGSADFFGDEPLLLAQQIGAPVYVGTDRYTAGLLAEQSHPTPTTPHLHLLDDGFQHRQLARALDIVLLTAEDAADTLLPAGNLREPLSRLADAGAIVLRANEAAALTPLLQHLAPNVPHWLIDRAFRIEAARAPARPLAFCGIARPADFFSMATQSGATLAGTLAFPDHHRYQAPDIRRLLKLARATGADSFITTEKDLVKLSATMRAQLEAFAPLAIARLTITFLDEAAVLRTIAAAIAPHPA